AIAGQLVNGTIEQTHDSAEFLHQNPVATFKSLGVGASFRRTADDIHRQEGSVARHVVILKSRVGFGVLSWWRVGSAVEFPRHRLTPRDRICGSVLDGG